MLEQDPRLHGWNCMNPAKGIQEHKRMLYVYMHLYREMEYAHDVHTIYIIHMIMCFFIRFHYIA